MTSLNKKIKVLIWGTFFFLCSFHNYAQDFDNYIPLRCSGIVPDDFRSNATEKYLSDLKAIKEKKGKDKESKRAEKAFSLSSNFQINDLLFSGRVLFGDPATNYINDVADILLANDLELRRKLRFYVIKSDVVNAFTTQQGIVFVNLGMLAQVNSEAELAFVLAHEIGHYVKNHVLEGYIKKDKIIKKKDDYQSMGTDQRIEELYKYSKSNESEADEWGFELYKKSKYSLKAISPLFDVLLYSYLPFDEIPFTYDFIENNYFKLPKKFKMDSSKIKDITAKEDEDDSRSTHPNIYKRKIKIDELIGEEKNTKNNTLYIVGESEFKVVQKIARYEVCHIYLTVGLYSRAFYSGWLLKKLYPETQYADKVMLMALYGLSKFERVNKVNDNKSFVVTKNEDEDDDDDDPKETGSWSNIEGSSQPVYYMLNKLSSDELSIIAAGLAWKYRSIYPKDAFINKISENLIRDLVIKQELSIKAFDLEIVDTAKVEINDTVSNEQLTKADKIKKKKKKVEKDSDKKFWKTIFIALQEKEKKALKNCFSTYIDRKKDEDAISAAEQEERRKTERKQEEREKKHGVALGIDKIMMLNPGYQYLEDDNDSYKTDLLKSEKGLVSSEKIIREVGSITGLQLIMLDKKGEEDVHILDNININNQMMSWITERLRYSDTSTVLFDNQYVDDLIKSTNTQYLGICAIRNAPKENYLGDVRKVLGCLMGLGVLMNPLFIGWGIHGRTAGFKGYTEYTFVLFNIKTNKIEYVDHKEAYIKASNELISQLLYNSLNGIKRKK